MKCEEQLIQIGRMWLRRGTLGLRGWEVGNQRHMRVGGVENQKLSHWGSVLTNNMWRALNLSLGDVVGEGYNGVDGLGGGYQVGCDGWGDLPENQKLSCQCLILAKKMQGALDSDQGNVVEEGYIRVEGLRGRE